MTVKTITTPCLQWCPTSVTWKRRALNDGVLSYRSTWLGTTSLKTDTFHFSARHISRAYSGGGFENRLSDEKFSRRINELALQFQIPDDESQKLQFEKKEKQKWREGMVEVSETAYCSVKKAFSSMVFIIRELHSYALQMRELLFFEDLQGILARVQKEMHASFVWIFQQVFSHTPILMVHVMILLANFTVHSMPTSAAIAAVSPPMLALEGRESGGVTNIDNKFDGPIVKSSSSDEVTPSTKTTTLVGENSGGGSKTKPVSSGTDGDGWGNLHRRIISEGESQFTTREEESASGYQGAEEMELWNSIVAEAYRMQADQVRDKALDHETMRGFVSPVTVKITGDEEYEDYLQTELLYQTGLHLEPTSVLLLTNYAQFLYLVAHDYDRAEEYFKKAIAVVPNDAEAHSKYATFLWRARNDLWAAEETFLEAISVDPSNSFYAANYAHFLWNTGGEDTCFPLGPNDETAP